MRFFYVPKLKRYIFLPAFISFAATLILQLYSPLFMWELNILAIIKDKLGYPAAFFSQDTFIPLRIFFSLFYAFTGGVAGILYFRHRHQRSGYTLLLSNSFKALAGISYLMLIYVLLHSELFIVKPVTFRAVALPQLVSSQNLISDLQKLLVPQMKVVNKNTNPIRASAPQYNTYQQPKAEYIPPATNAKPPEPTTPPHMATARELFDELNVYRQRNGKNALVWDDRLTDYSQKRADLYASTGKTDGHSGFMTDLNNGLNYQFKFYGLGENSGYGVTADAKFLIENWYGGSAQHNSNQLNASWTYVGIGVNGSATNFVFGGGKTESFHQD